MGKNQLTNHCKNNKNHETLQKHGVNTEETLTIGNVHYDKTWDHFAACFFTSKTYVYVESLCWYCCWRCQRIIYVVIVFGIPELFGMRSDSALAFQPQAATDQGRNFFVQNENNCFLTICVKQQFLDTIWFEVKCLSQGQLLFAQTLVNVLDPLLVLKSLSISKTARQSSKWKLPFEILQVRKWFWISDSVLQK